MIYRSFGLDINKIFSKSGWSLYYEKQIKNNVIPNCIVCNYLDNVNNIKLFIQFIITFYIFTK